MPVINKCGRVSVLGGVFASLLLCTVAASARADGKVVNIFFAGGQSNAVPEYWGEGIQSGLNDSGQFGAYRFVAQKHSGDSIWTWIGFTKPDGITVYNRNYNYEADFFNASGTGALQRVVNEVKANGDIPKVSLFWYQGEGDDGDDGKIDRWEGSFMSILQFVQEDVGQSEPVSFAVAMIDYDRSYDLDPAKLARVDRLRAIQADIGASYDYGVALDSGPYDRVDQVHQTHDANTQFGYDMATAYAANVPEPVSLTLLALGGFALIRRRR